VCYPTVNVAAKHNPNLVSLAGAPTDRDTAAAHCSRAHVVVLGVVLDFGELQRFYHGQHVVDEAPAQNTGNDPSGHTLTA
jgi:hypothetical protein